MALDKFEVRVSIQKILLGLVLVIVPLSIVGLYLTNHSDNALDASMGSHLKTVAQLYSHEISHLLNDRVAAVKLIAADPSVVEAVAAGNRAYKGQNEAAVSEKLEKMNGTWGGPEAATTVKTLLASKPSETLRHYHEMDPSILRMTVTDEHGVAVAATAKPARFSMAHDGIWQTVYSGGKGDVDIGNILYDDTTKSYYVDVGVPVTESGTQQLAGVALTAIDITPILATFQQDSLGGGLKAFLVNKDGTVVSGPKTDIFARVKSQEFGALGDALGTLEGRQTGYMTADLSGGRRIVGFADTGLQKQYPNLAWTVLISQDEHEATAPIRLIGQFAILMVVLAIFMLTLLFVYYALHRQQRFADIEGVLPSTSDLRPRTAHE
jgi:hypothetical protein